MIQHIEVSRVMPVETELFDRYIYASNTQSAWKRVAENGGSAAPGGTTISELQKDFPALWRPVKESLRAETSQPPQLKRVTLRQHLALRLLLDRRPLGEGWVLVSTGGNNLPVGQYLTPSGTRHLPFRFVANLNNASISPK
jgi:hypothetical protein